MSRLVRQTMGAEAAKLYTGVAAVLVESAAPYSLTGIAFLVPYARGSLYSVVFGQIWAKVTVSGQARHSWRINAHVRPSVLLRN